MTETEFIKTLKDSFQIQFPKPQATSILSVLDQMTERSLEKAKCKFSINDKEIVVDPNRIVPQDKDLVPELNQVKTLGIDVEKPDGSKMDASEQLSEMRHIAFRLYEDEVNPKSSFEALGFF